MATLDVSALTICDPQPGAKGAKMCNIEAHGKPVYWTPGQYMDVAFDCVGFDPEANRVNLNLRATPAVVAEIARLDEHIVQVVAANSERLLGRQVPLDRGGRCT